MIREGGIYIDLDTICQKSYEPLFGKTIVMGIESTSPGIEQWNTDPHVGLCNALMIAPENCEFLKIWHDEYKNFSDDIWNEFSVLRPAKLARLYPDIIKIEPPESFFWPIFVGDGLPKLFEQDFEFPLAYSIHLWESASWKYLVEIDAHSVLLKNTTYNKIARKYMEKDIDYFSRNAELSPNKAQEIGLEDIFSEIYEKKRWGNGSGLGSSPDNTAEYRAYLQRFLSENKVKSVIDFGCGDWQFSSLVDWSGIDYLGIDVAKEVLRRNIEKYQKENIRFVHFNSFNDFPKVDLVICKDVFQHLSNERIKEYLAEMKKIGRRLLITNDVEGANGVNTEIQDGEWRAVRIDEWPILAPATIIFSWLVRGSASTQKKATYLVYDN
jgi:2-polyprenyl-3-methyl-5-hydroxy-6-metoxy-1,4-benzoquinol methylase